MSEHQEQTFLQHALQQIQQLDAQYVQLDQQEKRLREALKQLREDERSLLQSNDTSQPVAQEQQRHAEERLAKALLASLQEDADDSSDIDSNDGHTSKV
jgi:hypothetical protein